MKPPQRYSFRSIYSRVRTKITESYFFRSIYPRVRTRITPKQIHIHNTQSTQRTINRPQSFYRRKDKKNVHQPLCIYYPNITAGIRKLSAITYIKWIKDIQMSPQVFIPQDIYHVFSSLNIQSDKTKLQRVKIQFITTRERTREREIKHIATGTYP